MAGGEGTKAKKGEIMEEEDVRMAASMWALISEMNAEMVDVEAMKALNSSRADRGQAQAYADECFFESAEKIRKIAGRLRDEI